MFLAGGKGGCCCCSQLSSLENGFYTGGRGRFPVLYLPLRSLSLLLLCSRCLHKREGGAGKGRAEAIPKFRGKLSERRIINEIRCIPDTIRPSPANRKKDDTHYSIERL